jgi:hypothetical protein
VESVVLVVLGFSLGLVADVLSTWWRRRSRKREIATVLGVEVYAIERTAQLSLEMNKPIIDKAKRDRERGVATSVAINDTDFPGDVYRAVLGDLELLGSEVGSLVTLLRRQVEYAHHWKRENLSHHDGAHAADARINRENPDSADVATRDVEIMKAVLYAETYAKVVAQVAGLARRTLTAISSISKDWSQYPASVHFEEGPISSEYP